MKTKRLEIRMSEDELNLVEWRAKTTNQTVSAYVRGLLDLPDGSVRTKEPVKPEIVRTPPPETPSVPRFVERRKVAPKEDPGPPPLWKKGWKS